jgi:hypothetical protein
MTSSPASGHPKAAVVLATAAVLLAGGCTSSSPSSSGSSRPEGAATVMPEVSSVPRLITAADRSLPIAPYLLSDKQSDELTAAQARLTEQCMARFGLHYTAPAPAPVFRPRTPTQFRYGVTDPKTAAVDGFAPAGSRTAPTAVAPAALSSRTTRPDRNERPARQTRLHRGRRAVLQGPEDPRRRLRRGSPGAAALRGAGGRR